MDGLANALAMLSNNGWHTLLGRDGVKVTRLSQGSHRNVRLMHESGGMTVDSGDMTETQAIYALRSERRADVVPSRPGVHTELPLDLREWFAPGVLANWVDEVIDQIKTQEPARTGEVGSMDKSGRAMLGLLGLGYLMGVFASSEIARDARTNTPLRLLGGGIFPFPHELRRFRRQHRALLTAVIFELFIRAASERLGALRARGGPELHAELLEAATTRLEIASQLDHAE